MATERIWDIQSFNGGESDDTTYGAENTFWAGENVDVRKDLAGMRLSSGLVDTGWAIDGTICNVTSLENWGLSGIIVCTTNGKIYLDGNPMLTITSAFKVVSGIGVMLYSGQLYIYYIATGSSCAIHRSDAVLSSGSFLQDHKTFTGYSATNVTVIGTDAGLLFNVNNKVKFLDELETLTDKIEFAEDTVGLTQFQNKYRVYANRGTTGVQYVWGGSQFQSYEYRQEWQNQPIRAVVSDGAYDYAILGINQFKSDIYQIAGTQKYPMYVAVENNTNSRQLYPFISSRLGIVNVSGGLTGESTNYGIYTMGSIYPKSPRSLVQEFSKSTTRFTYHAHTTAFSYFANLDGKVYKVSHDYASAVYPTSGYIITRKYQGFIWEDKSFKKMKVGFRLQTGTSIKIYFRSDMSSSWQLGKTIDYAIYGSKKNAIIYENEIKALSLGNFNELQIKFELVGDGTHTPTLYRATTFLEVVGNQ